MMDPEVISGANVFAPETNDAGRKAANGDGMATELSAAKGPSRRRANDNDELPPPGITRWVIRRKAQIVEAVRSGKLTLEEVCKTYAVSVEEFESWQALIERHGIYGLRSTRSQIYRGGQAATKTKTKTPG